MPILEMTMSGLFYEIRYRALFRGPSLCFPCDARGDVSLDALSDNARENYLYARAVVGVEYAHPTVSEVLPA